MIDKFGKYAQSVANRIVVRSALNPILWLSAIGTPICFFAAHIFRSDSFLLYLLIYLGSAPVITSCLGFLYFAIFRPEKLQSEEYQIQHETLLLIRQKEGKIPLDATSLKAIANPLGQLSEPENIEDKSQGEVE